MEIFLVFVCLAFFAIPFWTAKLSIGSGAKLFAKQLLEIEKVEAQKIPAWVKMRIGNNRVVVVSFALFVAIGMVPVALGLGYISSSVSLGLVSFLIGIFAAVVLYLKGGLSIREKAILMAVKMAHEHIKDRESIHKVENWLYGLLMMDSEGIREIALDALLHWGSERSLELLKGYNSKERPLVKIPIVLLIKSMANYEKLKSNYSELEIERVSTYPKFMYHGYYWLRLARDAFSEGDFGNELGLEIQGNKTAIVMTKLKKQKDLKSAGVKGVFCVECKTRAEKRNFEGWHYLTCRSCREMTFLRPGIEKVIGVLGPVSKDENHQGDYSLSLWNVSTNKAMPAEIDRLEIRPGLNFNYDWMVSATLEALRNRFPNRKLSFEVDIDPQIKLSANTLNLVHGLTQ